jgi:hypothetical protein
VHALARESNAVCMSLQGLTTLVSQQRAKLSGLVDTYCRITGMTGPLTDNQMSALEAPEMEVSGRFSLTHANTRHFMDGLDLWVVQNISTLELEIVNFLTVAVAKMFGQAANGIHDIVAERDSVNNASDDLPPVLPHQLVKNDMRDLSKIISEHNPRLFKTLSSIEIHQIGKDFVDLLRIPRRKKFQRSSRRLHRFVD